mmetsp:Transcript_87573/g.242937  ORF Transcript_87573/g.242937 Transcript_87573/m.242937 type:complete len:201 (-) Transcript_87573:119-721(-)
MRQPQRKHFSATQKLGRTNILGASAQTRSCEALFASSAWATSAPATPIQSPASSQGSPSAPYCSKTPSRAPRKPGWSLHRRCVASTTRVLKLLRSSSRCMLARKRSRSSHPAPRLSSMLRMSSCSSSFRAGRMPNRCKAPKSLVKPSVAVSNSVLRGLVGKLQVFDVERHMSWRPSAIRCSCDCLVHPASLLVILLPRSL